MSMQRPRISWRAPLLSRGLSQRPKKKNHYDSLEVDSKATQNEIKSAYFKLTMQYHPDKNPSDEAKVKFRNIAEAYEVLGNYNKRRQYDRGMQIRTEDVKGPEVRKPVDITKEAYRARSAIYRQSDGPGTSRMYDFDEWTKAHYGNTFKRRMTEKKDLNQLREEKKWLRNRNSDSAREMRVFSVFMCFIVVGMGVLMTRGDLDNPREIESKGTKGT